jgi:hypothetical protein
MPNPSGAGRNPKRSGSLSRFDRPGRSASPGRVGRRRVRAHRRERDGIVRGSGCDGSPGGNYQARWREFPGAPEQARNFALKRDADAFAVKVENSKLTGSYVDPSAGKITFGQVRRRVPGTAGLASTDTHRERGGVGSCPCRVE